MGLSESYGEVATKATDVIQNSEGVSSKGVTKKELEEIACENKEQRFQADKHGVTPDNAIQRSIRSNKP